MGAWIGAVGNAVAIDVEIAAEFPPFLQHLCGHHLAAIILPGVIPLQRARQTMVHADIEVEHHEYRGLQALGEVKRGCREFERFSRILRKQQHMLGVAMRCIGADQDVALLGSGRHARRWTCALHIHDHRRDLGEIREPDEFLHQGDTWTGGGGEGARAVP